MIVIDPFLGNALVCIVISKKRDMRTVTNLFLLNMAASDMFSTLFAVPSLLATEISPNRWPLGDLMCPATNVISTISVSVSIYSMVALALERFVHNFTVSFQHFLVWGPVTIQVKELED